MVTETNQYHTVIHTASKNTHTDSDTITGRLHVVRGRYDSFLIRADVRS